MTTTRKRLLYGALAFFFVASFYLIQCRSKGEETNKIGTATTTTTTAPSPDTAHLLGLPAKQDTGKPKEYGLAAKSISAPVDTLFVDVNENGICSLGNNKMDADFLRRNLVDSLIVLKKQTGKYPNKIKLRTHGDVLMGVRDDVKDKIQEAKDSLKIN